MILEVSFSLMTPSLWSLYVGWKSVGGDESILEAHSFIVKFLPIMLQVTVYNIREEDDE